MKCPSCGSERVFHSRAKSRRDKLARRLLPITFKRCHDCNWRRARFRGGAKSISLWLLSLTGYFAGAALILAVAAILLGLTFTFLGIPMPWSG